MQPYHDPMFLKEIWGLFGVGATVLLLRTFVRIRTVGVRNFCGDDYVSLLVLLCYIGDAVTVTITYKYGTNIDFTQEQFASMTEQQLHIIEIGSKMELLAWYSYSGLIWALKVCMLFFFYRLTAGLELRKYVKLLAYATGVTYLAVFLTVSCGCYPIQKNWQIMPSPGEQCTFKTQNFYVVSILNIITDAAILCVPLPLLWRLKVNLKRKLGLAILLFPGIFVITAALIRVVYSLSANPSSLNVNRWGVRETIAGIIAVNVPILRPLFLKSFWQPGFDINNRPTAQSSGKRSNKGRSANTSTYEMFDTPSNRAVDNSRKPGWQTTTAIIKDIDGESQVSSHEHDFRPDTSSEEYIIQHPHDPVKLPTDRDIENGVPRGRGVIVETTFESNVHSWGGPPAGMIVRPWESIRGGISSANEVSCTGVGRRTSTAS